MFARISQRTTDGLAELAENTVGGGTPELVFVLEVVGDERVMNTGSFSDVARRCALKAVFRKGFDCSIKQLLLRDDRSLLLLPGRSCGPYTVRHGFSLRLGSAFRLASNT